MQTERTHQYHKGDRRRRSRDLTRELAMQAKAPPPEPAVVPSLDEIAALLGRQKLTDAARGLNAVIGRCASDVPVDLARAFVDAAVPALRLVANGLRNGNRKAVTTAISGCVRRLSGELSVDDKKKLVQFLHAQGCSGTAHAFLE